jgi:hypothetical protein
MFNMLDANVNTDRGNMHEDINLQELLHKILQSNKLCVAVDWQNLHIVH